MARAATSRLASGYYRRTLDGRSVTLDRLDEGAYRGWWMARADWDAFTYSDPVPTKREAVAVADAMITAASTRTC